MAELIFFLLLGLSMPPARAQHGSPALFLDGHESGGIYTNDYFRFAFKLPLGWENVPESTKAAVLNSLNAKAPNTDNRVLIMLRRPADGEPTPDVIAFFSAFDSSGGPSGAKGGAAYFQNRPPRASDLIAPIGTVELGGQTFAREVVQLRGQPDFMADFVSVKTGYLLSFQAVAATQDRLNAVVKILSASVQFH